MRTDAALGMDLADLRQKIAADRRQGGALFLVAGTAGTTASGAFDPLRELAVLCRDEKLWLHVDAAWGGQAALVDELRPLLDGIEHADSVTWDAHKTLPVPMGAGMFFCRAGAPSAAAFGVETLYVPDPERGTRDLYQHSMQWSRRCIGLKVLLTVAELGWPGVADLVRRQVSLGRRLRDALQRAGWIPVSDSPLPIVCFTHPRIESDERSATRVVESVLRRGRAWISSVRLSPSSPPILRACITSHRTGAADLQILIDELQHALESHEPAAASPP